MTWEERKRLVKERKNEIIKMSDKEKLNHAIGLLKREQDVEMLTDCSDTHGIDFTDEWNETQVEIEVFLEYVND